VITSIWALRQPAIYQAKTSIRIEPPELSPLLSALVAKDIGTGNSSRQSQYVPDRVAMLQSSGLAELVVGDPRIANDMNQSADPAADLLNNLQVKSNWPKNSMSIVTVESRDPVLAKKLLEVLIEKFKEITDRESKKNIEDVREHAEQSLRDLKKRQESLDGAISLALEKYSKAIGPSGRNLFEEQLIHQDSLLQHKEMRLGEVQQQLMLTQLFPKELKDELDSPMMGRLAELEGERKLLTRRLNEIKRTARHYSSDPVVRHFRQRLRENLEELNEIKAIPTRKAQQGASPTDLILEQSVHEIEAEKATREQILSQLRESMPGYRKYLELEQDRKDVKQEIAEVERNIRAFATISLSQNEPVQDAGNGNVKEPTVPVRPNRMITITMGLILSLAAGVGLVCLLEHFDHRVKVPEHVTSGLTLPLLGVIPRMRRTALNHRAGHLWTPGAPDSLEADAFRNVRASLLGVSDHIGPLVTLLVTSAKAGEGKSTAALNLAATFAKAGERTLLLDIDLRRGSLGDVFGAEEDNHDDPKRGLVDVLRGRLPWQRTVRRTPIGNLDFIPTGDTFDIPIEILGTRELRQLLLALSHHYDRVILDGPAVLGLADCLVLGRLVDATLLVVRSGTHQLTTVHRAKVMLEQARVPIAGVVFNSLSEGIDSWSSYVSEQPALFSTAGQLGGGERLATAPDLNPNEPESASRHQDETFEYSGSGTAGRV
jgi:capsular exopolysaccharide synthesis family protein